MRGGGRGSSMVPGCGGVDDGDDPRAGDERAAGLLAGFRRELYRCFARRADALLELADAVLCRQDRVHMLAELSLEPECRRGHGAVYDALNCGDVQVTRLRWALAGLPLPAWPDGRIRLAVDVSNWLRPDAATSPGRLFCHCYGRGKGNAQMIPGWPYSLVAALEPGRTSWTLPLDAVRLGPDDDLTAVTAAQVRERRRRGSSPPGTGTTATRTSWSSSTPGMTWPGWPGCCATCPCRCSGGCAATGCCCPRPAPPARPDGRPAPARRRAQAPRTRRPGPARRAHRHRDRPVRHRQARPGTGMHPAEPAAPVGRPPRGNCRSSRAPSSGWPSITCPATAAPSRCGCGHHAPAPPPTR